MSDDEAKAREARVDRTGWAPGPWDDEPDRLEWRLPELPQYPMLITRNDYSGNLCGYVAVPPGHPAHGKEPDDLELDAHGGVNYAGSCSGKICHVPQPGEPDDVWWFGFDCAHGFDVMPGLEARHPMLRALREEAEAAPAEPLSTDRYRDLPYVKGECEELARQLAALEKP
jgi:hypothetical protein